MPDLLAGTTILAQDTPPVVYARIPDIFDNFTTTGYEPTATPCEITFLAPTTGRIKINIFVRADADTDGERFSADVEVRENDGTGTVVHSPDSTTGAVQWEWPTAAAANSNISGWRYITGLTPGATYWAQLQFNVTGTDFDISDQALLYEPLS